jgi:hypothetical protein
MNCCSFTGFGDLPVKLFYRMFNTNTNVILRKVVQADLNLQPRSSACWSAKLPSAFQGLCGCESYVRAVQTGRVIPIQEFTVDLKHRMRGAELVKTHTHNNRLKSFSWFAIPFSSNERMPTIVRGISILICPNILRAMSVDSACMRIL